MTLPDKKKPVIPERMTGLKAEPFFHLDGVGETTLVAVGVGRSVGLAVGSIKDEVAVAVGVSVGAGVGVSVGGAASGGACPSTGVPSAGGVAPGTSPSSPPPNKETAATLPKARIKNKPKTRRIINRILTPPPFFFLAALAVAAPWVVFMALGITRSSSSY